MKLSMNCFKTLLFSAVIIFGIRPVLAIQSFRAEKPLGEIEKSMEANLTWNLQNALLLYYPENKFVVNTRVKLQKVSPKTILPELPDALLSKDLTNLPGLPYLPESLAEAKEAPQDNLRSQINKKKFEINRIRVDVLVDKSLVQKDWSFIRRFVNLTANLEPSRGDAVRIEGLDFPEKADFFPEDEEEVAATLNESLAKPEAFNEPQKSKVDWMPYVFAAGLALLLLLLFWAGQRNIAKFLKHPDEAASKAKVLSPNETITLPSRAAANGSTKNEIVQSSDALKARVIDVIVGAPNASSKVFSGWIEEQGDEGLFHTAIVLSVASRSLTNLMEPHFGQQLTIDIHQRITLLTPEEVEQNSVRLLTQFDGEANKLILKDKYDSEVDALEFLNHMTDEQLQHLIKPLKTGVMAIVLAQLKTNRTAKLISKLDSDERKIVLSAMGNIDKIPADVYKHIANQLAVRANDLQQMRYVRANGTDALVKVLDYMDEDEQNETIQYIQTKDVFLARKVNKQFMTFGQLINQSSDKMREVALEIDRDTLAKSLITLDDNVVEGIITSLPEKLGELVRASLEVNINIPESEVADARRAMMRKLRLKRIS